MAVTVAAPSEPASLGAAPDHVVDLAAPISGRLAGDRAL